MLLVKTKIGPSKLHGAGLFAEEFIQKGTVIWKFTPGFDQKFTEEQILSFPTLLQIYCYKYCWKGSTSGLYCISSDNGKYFNHSKDPNTLSQYVPGEEEVVTTAIKDIQAGEEITDDYSTFESDEEEGNVLAAIAKKYALVDELDPRLKPPILDYDAALTQVQNTPRVHGYISSGTETKKSPIHGLGLFAKNDVNIEEVVAAWGGCVTTKAEIEALSEEIGYHYALELYPGFYLAERSVAELDSADFINHSCDPNCEIIDKFIMRTKKDVRGGEELTADFSNHSDHGEKFDCHCGAVNCRKVIYFD